MKSYETSAAVQAQDQVRLLGVPFAAGTEVEITISPKVPVEKEVTPADDDALAAARNRMRELFQTVKGFRMSPRIPREDLYERGSLR